MDTLKWTPADIRALRDFVAQGLTDAKIAAAMGRTLHGVKQRRQRMGIKQAQRVNLWTQAEDTYLTQAWADAVALDTMALHLQRTPQAVRSRGKKLGLTRARQDHNAHRHATTETL